MENVKTKNTVATTTTITADSIQQIGVRIALKALQTCYQASGQPYIYKLYCDLIGDLQGNNISLSDGYDIAQTAIVALCDYIGKTLDDACNDSTATDKDGNIITVSRAVFRAVNKYIMGERARAYRHAYLDDIDKQGNAYYIEVPQEWDTPTTADYNYIVGAITALPLTAKQLQILRYRLRGHSVNEIARKLGVHKKTVQQHMQAIQRKYLTYTANTPKK